MRVNECDLTQEQYIKLIKIKKEGIRKELIDNDQSVFHTILSVFPCAKIAKFDILEVTKEELRKVRDE